MYQEVNTFLFYVKHAICNLLFDKDNWYAPQMLNDYQF